MALLRSPIVQRIPYGAKPQSPLFARLCNEVVTHPSNARAWWKLLAFPKLVLFRTPRGGERNVVHEFTERCKKFVQEEYQDLIRQVNEANERAGEHARQTAVQPDPQTQPHRRFATEDHDIDLGLSTDITDVDSLRPAQMRRVMRLAREGALSRACAAMSAAEIAPTTDENLAKMEALHPVSVPPPNLPPRSGAPLLEKMKPQHLKAMLRAFPACSAAGLSGLSPSSLLDIVGSPAADCAAPVAELVNLVADGNVPECVRPFVYGARLVALVKKDGGLRPIACGDVFRRCAGKWAVKCVASQLGPS